MRTWTVATCRRCWTVRRVLTGYHSPGLREVPPLGPAPGFTLLELALVLVIVGLLLTVATPRLPDLTGARLQASARRFAALVRYVSGEAVFRSQVYRLHYDLDRHAYWVTVVAVAPEAAEVVGDESPLSRPVHLPPTVRFADVYVPTVGRVRTGEVYTHFYPHGDADPTIVHLRDHSARVLTIVIPPLTGEARIYDGYVDGFAGH